MCPPPSLNRVKVHSLNSGNVEMYLCASCHALTLQRGCTEKLDRHCGSDLGQGVVHVQRSIVKPKKKQNFVNISNNGYVDWLLHQNVFPLREQNSILPSKFLGFIFQELFRSPFTELAFEFDIEKEFMLKVFIKFIRLLRLVEKVTHIF